MASEAQKKFQAAIEAALEEYVREETGQDDQSGMVVDWVVGYTEMIWLEGDDSPMWRNRLISKIGQNPNAQAHLAQWASDCFSEVLLEGVEGD